MNGWVKINNNRYEVQYNGKTYLTAVIGKRTIENRIGNESVKDIESIMLIENSLIYNSGLNTNPYGLYRKYIPVDLKKINITNYLEKEKMYYYYMISILKKELDRNINNRNYIKMLKSVWGENWHYIIIFINENCDIMKKIVKQKTHEPSKKR